MRAVIIEKDEKILQQIQSILQKVDSGYELVGTAVNGQSGYELISALRPNLVIMDIELPRMNGMSMLKKLRAEVKTAVEAADKREKKKLQTEYDD